MAGDKPTKTQRTYINELVAIMQRFEWDMAHRATREGRIPDAWRAVWKGRTRRKVKMSFWIEEDVVKFYRTLGPGHGPRMNEVLRAFMLARLAGMLEGEDLPESYRETWMGRAKPSLAEAVARMEQLGGEG
ncbi:MAG: BrnA antitoxin family protein [Jannaschia sp.]